MTEGLDSILEQCLSQIAAGKTKVSSCLARYPDVAPALEPMLLAAEALWATPKPELAPTARARIEARVLEELVAQHQVPLVEQKRVGLSLGWRLAVVGVSAIVLVLFVLSAMIPSVGDILSGSPLHRVRWVVEDTWLLLAPRPQEPRLQLTFARRRLGEVQALTERGTVDPSVVHAMTQATEAALTDAEVMPPLIAVPLVGELMVLIVEQQETLSALQSTVPPTSRDGVMVALQANAEQKSRTQVLVSSLPMPPVLSVSETASPSTVPEPGGVVEFTVLVTNDGAEAVTLTSITSGIRGDPSERGACSVSEEGLSLRPGDSFECAFSAFVFHDAGGAETDTVTAVAVDAEGNTAQVTAAASVTIADIQPAISVRKSADPSTVPEPGGTVHYTVGVRNRSPESVMLTSLVDDVHGNLDGQGTCTVADRSSALEPDETYLCAFSAQVLGNAGEATSGLVTAVAVDDEGNQTSAADAATVAISDTSPRIIVSREVAPSGLFEPGGVVEFTVRVVNPGAEEITLGPLLDDLHGDLNGRGSCAVGPVGIVIRPGDSYECSYHEQVEGNAGFGKTGTVTARAFDDEGNSVSATAGSTVTISDKLPVITVSKAANRSTIPEPGGEAGYAIVITNDGVEPVTLASLTDDLHGDLRGRGTCLVSRSGLVLVAGGAYRCTFSTSISGNAGDVESSLVTAVAVDDEGNQVQASGSASMSVVDVLPRIEVSSGAVPENLPEPGGSVRFSVGIVNSGAEELVLLSLRDDELGDLNDHGTCRIPPSGISLGSRESYRCTFSVDVSGSAGESVTDTLVAAAIDDEGNHVKAVAAVKVQFSDAMPAVAVGGTARPKEVPEPGGAVEYTISITNKGKEAVVFSALRSDVHGDLNGQGTCSAPEKGLSLAAGDSYRCTYAADLVGNARTLKTNRVTVDASDDEGNRIEASGSVTVSIRDLLPVITVVNALDPGSVPEPGGTVRFALQVTNDGAESFRLASLRDILLGDLNGQGTCLVPEGGMLLRPGSAYKCAFGADVTGNGGDVATNVITVRSADDEGNEAEASSRATVRITDVKPVVAVVATTAPTSVPESGGLVHFTMEVTNLGAEAITVTTLADDVHGDLQGLGTCMVPAAGIQLGPGEGYECSFTAEVTGDAGQPQVDTLAAHASDDEGNQVVAGDGATVAITDVPPLISVVNRSTPSSVSEPGGEVEHVLQVTNQSGETVKLTLIVDGVYGDLNGQGSCSIPLEGLVLASGETYTCDFRAEVLGNAGEVSADTVTVHAVDDEGNRVEVADSATVTVADVPPNIAVVTAATPSSLPEPGGFVQFSAGVTNEGAEYITLTSLQDEAQGDLNSRGTCFLPPGGIGLAPDEVYYCGYSAQISGDAGGLETNAVRVSASDDEGNSVEVVSAVSVAFTDVRPAITIAMTAMPNNLPEQGGEVDYALQVTNVGMEAVNIISLADAALGDLNEQGSCYVPTGGIVLDPGKAYGCTYRVAVAGISGGSHTSTVRATAIDNEGNSEEAVGTATVTITGAPPISGTATLEP